MDTSPVYKNGNVLREYQLEGVNWLTFCWCNRWKVLPLCWYTIKIILFWWYVLLQGWSHTQRHLTFCYVTTGFPAKCCVRMECRNSILMTYHFPDLGSASDSLCCVRSLLKPIRIATQIWIVTGHHYGFLCSFCRETCGSVAKSWLFSLVTSIVIQLLLHFSNLLLFVRSIFYLFLLFRQNSILADEMGLGKTIQSISFLIEMQVSVNPHVGSPMNFIHLILW